MAWLTPNTFVTFVRGMTLPTVAAVYAEAGRPALASGSGAGWVWLTHDAYSAPRRSQAGELARDLTGFRHAHRASDPGGAPVESVFLASTPPCPCPHGQNYVVPHCDEHPIQFTHASGGFEGTYFNFGMRRESRRAGGSADLLVRELLDAGIVGRDTPRYDADPAFNADGTHTVRIIAAHFGLPSPPLTLS
ncbi:hypothetical protein [Actinacidiphila glaucinigra]|uniref:hypothetical protein n=1 Tax=Actinacidiphila glaucinigra TaxID=235986 RepID=UPI00371E1503